MGPEMSWARNSEPGKVSGGNHYHQGLHSWSLPPKGWQGSEASVQAGSPQCLIPKKVPVHVGSKGGLVLRELPVYDEPVWRPTSRQVVILCAQREGRQEQKQWLRAWMASIPGKAPEGKGF